MKNTAKKRVGGGKNKNYIANNKNDIYGAKNEKKKIEYRDVSANKECEHTIFAHVEFTADTT